MIALAAADGFQQNPAANSGQRSAVTASRRRTPNWSRMGRESRFLLGLLGLLAAVFVAVVAVRLFVPRPPQGAGPDIHATDLATVSTPTVAPPDLTPRPLPRSAATRPKPPTRPLAVAEPLKLESIVVPRRDQPKPPAPPAAVPSPPTARLVSNTEPLAETPPGTAAPPWASASSDHREPPATAFPRPDIPRPVQPPAAADAVPPDRPLSPPEQPPVTPGVAYRVVAADSWWSIAERAYGDGRYYRSLFAWNRTLNPRISLAAGTTLEIPPADRLQLAWPRLIPAD